MNGGQRGSIIAGIWLVALNEARFPRTADGWASADAAARHAEIRVQGGVGSGRIG